MILVVVVVILVVVVAANVVVVAAILLAVYIVDIGLGAVILQLKLCYSHCQMAPLFVLGEISCSLAVSSIFHVYQE